MAVLKDCYERRTWAARVCYSAHVTASRQSECALFVCQPCQFLVGLYEERLRVSGELRRAADSKVSTSTDGTTITPYLACNMLSRRAAFEKRRPKIAWPLLERRPSEALESEQCHRHAPRKPPIVKDAPLAPRLPGRSALLLMVRLARPPVPVRSARHLSN